MIPGVRGIYTTGALQEKEFDVISKLENTFRSLDGHIALEEGKAWSGPHSGHKPCHCRWLLDK